MFYLLKSVPPGLISISVTTFWTKFLLPSPQHHMAIIYIFYWPNIDMNTIDSGPAASVYVYSVRLNVCHILIAAHYPCRRYWPRYPRYWLRFGGHNVPTMNKNYVDSEQALFIFTHGTLHFVISCHILVEGFLQTAWFITLLRRCNWTGGRIRINVVL